MGCRPRRNCGITSALGMSEDSDLHNPPADIGAVAPEDPNELRDECLELVFGFDSVKSFSGFDGD